jgi:hypothetical protein
MRVLALRAYYPFVLAIAAGRVVEPDGDDETRFARSSICEGGLSFFGEGTRYKR